jgi:methylmalonyl-CoA mutase cobalamin-binding subunit
MKTVVAAALGECVHIAGVSRFLNLAEQAGWRVVFLGPATPIEVILDAAKREKADLVGVSYRLTPENGESLLGEFAEEADELRNQGVKFVFGGTPPVVDRVKKLNFFEALFDGTQHTTEIIAYLRGHKISHEDKGLWPQNMIDRIKIKSPFPLIRHHYGVPGIQETITGVQKIAEAEVLDVISLGIDQDAQENFFHPERQEKRRMGAGGVPVRSPADYRKLYDATRFGNFPLMRTYSGTDDFTQLAEMYVETIKIAWAAIPLYWFNQMDRRGPWNLEGSIREHQKLMAWYGKRDIPVEANEAHHWGLRDAPDVIFVVSAYLAAYNAKVYGVKDHIIQLMFNCPAGTTTAMDIAKMLAVIKMTSRLETPEFRIWKQTRTGLLSYPVDLNQAKAHLAISIFNQMALDPNIVHVVGYPEANHAVSADEVIESCVMAQRAIESALESKLDIIGSKKIQLRTQELVSEADFLLEAIQELGVDKSLDSLSDANLLAEAVFNGYLDAPQLINNPFGQGKIKTKIDHRGACIVIDRETGEHINEETRISQIQKRNK